MSPTSWDLNALTFQVPVTLSDESVASVKIGGMTFYKSLTLAKETGKLFSLSRNMATVLLFSGEGTWRMTGGGLRLFLSENKL